MAAPPADPDRPALAQLAGLHPHLPVPLSPGNIDAWLDLRAVELVKDEDGLHRLETVDNPVV